MKRGTAVFIMVIGLALVLAGLIIQVPHKELTTYSWLEDEYSVIEKYVGGDAYNYIIGASLVGGEIAGAKAQQAIFISVGLLIFCFGVYATSKIEVVREEATKEENECNEEEQEMDGNNEADTDIIEG